MSKVHKEQGITSPDMSPRREGPLTRQIRAQLGGEKGQNPYQINSKWRESLQDPSRGLMKTTNQRWGHSGLVGVPPHPVWHVSSPSLVGHLSNDGYMGDGGNLNAQNVSLVPSMRG